MFGALQIDDVTAFGSDILGFTTDDTINLSKVAYDTKGSVTLEQANVKKVVENGRRPMISTSSRAESSAADEFVLSKDTTTGSDITSKRSRSSCNISFLDETPSTLVRQLGDLVVDSTGSKQRTLCQRKRRRTESQGQQRGHRRLRDRRQRRRIHRSRAAAGERGRGSFGDLRTKDRLRRRAPARTRTISGGEQEGVNGLRLFAPTCRAVAAGSSRPKETSYEFSKSTRAVRAGRDRRGRSRPCVENDLVKVNDGGALKAATAIKHGTGLSNDARH